jgi:hypothetical protein
MHPRITAVRVHPPYTLALTFQDGFEGLVDLTGLLQSHSGVIGALKDPHLFGSVRVDADAGTIVWRNGADLDPDVLYEAARSGTPVPNGLKSAKTGPN